MESLIIYRSNLKNICHPVLAPIMVKQGLLLTLT